MVGETDIEFLGHLALALFDHFVGELDHLATVEANQMVVVLLSGQLEYRLATFEVVTGNDTGIIKLVENAIDGSETNLFTQVELVVYRDLRRWCAGNPAVAGFPGF